LATEKYHNRVRFGGNESEEENILRTTVIAFKDRVSEGREGMKLDFLVASTDKMVNDVGGSRISTSTAEPLATS
jgi:hypothetical protein